MLLDMQTTYVLCVLMHDIMSLPDVMLYDKTLVLNSFGLFCLQALVSRMSLLPRLKYILEVVKPQAPTVIHILQILVRVARHSTKIAYQVSLLPRLEYILEVMKPQAPTVIHILQILIRVARHSIKLAYQVSPGPKVIKLFKSIEN